MANVIDLTGEVFGRLTVVKRATCTTSVSKHKSKSYWECRCQCGKTRYVWGHNLIAGYSKSCGCFRVYRLQTRKRIGERIRLTHPPKPKAFVSTGRIHFREARMHPATVKTLFES